MKKADQHRALWIGGLAAGAAVIGAGVWWYEKQAAANAVYQNLGSQASQAGSTPATTPAAGSTTSSSTQTGG